MGGQSRCMKELPGDRSRKGTSALSAAIGFRAHSGWAVAVAVAGGEVVERRRIDLCDCLIPGSAQPYHTAARMALDEAEAYLKRCANISAGMAEADVGKMAAALRSGGYGVRCCAILLGAGRVPDHLAKVLASHPMIHTAEGEFYREAIREGCRRCGLPVHGVKERDLRPRLAEVAKLGSRLGPPWRQDEKLCTIAGLQAFDLQGLTHG